MIAVRTIPTPIDVSPIKPRERPPNNQKSNVPNVPHAPHGHPPAFPAGSVTTPPDPSPNNQKSHVPNVPYAPHNHPPARTTSSTLYFQLSTLEAQPPTHLYPKNSTCPVDRS